MCFKSAEGRKLECFKWTANDIESLARTLCIKVMLAVYLIQGLYVYIRISMALFKNYESWKTQVKDSSHKLDNRISKFDAFNTFSTSNSSSLMLSTHSLLQIHQVFFPLKLYRRNLISKEATWPRIKSSLSRGPFTRPNSKCVLAMRFQGLKACSGLWRCRCACWPQSLLASWRQQRADCSWSKWILNE